MGLAARRARWTSYLVMGAHGISSPCSISALSSGSVILGKKVSINSLAFSILSATSSVPSFNGGGAYMRLLSTGGLL